MRLFDSHAHLQDSRLRDRTDEILARAGQAGVARIVCCGAREADWPDVQALARGHAQLVPAYGLHPWYLRERTTAWAAALRDLLEADPAAAVGEIGLDHAIDGRDDADQAAVLLAHLELARRLGRPASVHCRRAWSALLDALDRAGGLPAGFVVHSYSGSRELIGPLAARGGHFSFSGSITYPRNRRGRLAAEAVPPDRLLIETDAPDLLPRPAAEAAGAAGGEPPPNEPAHLAHVLLALAEIRRAAPEPLAEQIWKNAARVFGPRGARG